MSAEINPGPIILANALGLTGRDLAEIGGHSTARHAQRILAGKAAMPEDMQTAIQTLHDQVIKEIPSLCLIAHEEGQLPAFRSNAEMRGHVYYYRYMNYNARAYCRPFNIAALMAQRALKTLDDFDAPIVWEF